MSNEYNNLDNVIELKDYITNENQTEEPQSTEDIFKNLEQLMEELEKKGAKPEVLMGQLLHGLKEFQDGCSDEEIESIHGLMSFITTIFVGIQDENPDISPREHMDQFIDVLIEAFEHEAGNDGEGDNGEQS